MYHYKISTLKNVFNYDLEYEVHLPLDLVAMNQACEILFQYRDFQCFSKSKTDVKTYNCTILEANWVKHENNILFVIKANRFLRNMVRAIVGTFINIGLGKLQPNDLHAIIQSKDRGEAGFSVPAHGLYLVEIEYPNEIRLIE